MDNLDVDGMLFLSCSAVQAGVRESTIDHDMSGMACLAREHFWKRVVIGTFSGILMCFYRCVDELDVQGREMCDVIEREKSSDDPCKYL